MSTDPRCCGSGTCIIDIEGRCWCGQQWDGQRMGPAPVEPDKAGSPEFPSEPEAATDSP